MSSVNVKDSQMSSVARLDFFAIGISALCVIHCVALPLLVAIMPVIAQAAENELAHKLIVLAAVPVSLRVIWITLPLDGNKLFVGVVLVGLTLLILAAFIEAISAYEQPVTIAGAALLSSAHIWHIVRRSGKRARNILAIEPNET